MSISTAALFMRCLVFLWSFTHLFFAIARIVGWSAHRLEEIVGMNKIIRPAYKSVMKEIE